MTGWLIAASVVCGAVLLAMLPVGIDGRFGDGSLVLTGRVGLVPVRVWEKPSADGGRQSRRKTERRPISVPMWKILLQNGYNVLCRIVSAGRVDVLRVRFTAAWPDPAAAAMMYACAGAAMEGVQRVCERAELRSEVDFDRTRPAAAGQARLSVRLYRLLGGALCFGGGVLRDWLAYRRETKRKDE